MVYDIFGIAPWAVISGVGAWFGNNWLRARQIRVDDRKTDASIEEHRDGLTFQLLNAAREEMSSARREIEELRSEVGKLRPLEEHFFNFQQALNHIEAILGASPQDRKNVERNAKAFLNRMRRMDAAKGTINNEVQRVQSATDMVERIIIAEEDKNK